MTKATFELLTVYRRVYPLQDYKYPKNPRVFIDKNAQNFN